ncbi:Beta-ketoacyl-acyl-carrier-protein synthase I [Serratia marcescens]|uniref:NADP-dependent oxidoreductase n=1 Tax=Serratia marcescens TaxID=615 RepID=UPI0021772071|nr:NADP-dependent oxidoreductase [Serratia marcescens]CAI1633211.1 Beta-ketoacyl-acyl-carrier-protein synthase I [Serratia marcescens]HEJ7268895.1 NADP-dependent oxidoreductase [Serratia marcescens]
MNQQFAAVLYSYGAEGTIKIAPINRPQVSPGKVIVEIAAAGINPLDWKLRDGLLKNMFPLSFPCILGGEFSGKIIEVGAGVTTFKVGDRVIGKPLNRGAFAETIEITPDVLIPVPDGLDDAVAATLPVAGSTAWTGLFDIGQVKPGQTVFIQGAAGGVGSLAIPLARRAGAKVIAAASQKNGDYVKALGATDVIDSRDAHALATIKGVDLVLDLVGGRALEALWNTLAPQGRIVSSVAVDIAERRPDGQAGTGTFFQMKYDRAILSSIAKDIAKGVIPVTPPREFYLKETSLALNYVKNGGGRGKAVIRMK